ncbi:MAG: hypothetical protein IBX55_00280 [Methyloprofundus sp.]|nr:hypothetical protein [Methyloprofundus sp.]
MSELLRDLSIEKEIRFTILKTQTSGLSKDDVILALDYKLFDGDNIKDYHSYYALPEGFDTVGREGFRVSGINPGSLREGIDGVASRAFLRERVLPRLASASFLGHDTVYVCGFNIGFSISTIENELGLADKSDVAENCPLVKIIDTQRVAQVINGRLEGDFDDICVQFGVSKDLTSRIDKEASLLENMISKYGLDSVISMSFQPVKVTISIDPKSHDSSVSTEQDESNSRDPDNNNLSDANKEEYRTEISQNSISQATKKQLLAKIKVAVSDGVVFDVSTMRAFVEGMDLKTRVKPDQENRMFLVEGEQSVILGINDLRSISPSIASRSTEMNQVRKEDFIGQRISDMLDEGVTKLSSFEDFNIESAGVFDNEVDFKVSLQRYLEKNIKIGQYDAQSIIDLFRDDEKVDFIKNHSLDVIKDMGIGTGERIFIKNFKTELDRVYGEKGAIEYIQVNIAMYEMGYPFDAREARIFDERKHPAKKLETQESQTMTMQ